MKLFENDNLTLPARVFLKQKSTTTGYCYVFKFLRGVVWTAGKHLMRFPSETSVFKFVDEQARLSDKLTAHSAC